MARRLAHQFDTSMNSYGLRLPLITVSYYRNMVKSQLAARSPHFAVCFYPVFHKVNSWSSALMGTGREGILTQIMRSHPSSLYAKGSDFSLSQPFADLLAGSQCFVCPWSSSSLDGRSPNKQQNDPNPAGGERVQSKRPRNFTKWIISPWVMRCWKSRFRLMSLTSLPECNGDQSANKVAPRCKFCVTMNYTA